MGAQRFKCVADELGGQRGAIRPNQDDSVFLPNQASFEKRLHSLAQIARRLRYQLPGLGSDRGELRLPLHGAVGNDAAIRRVVQSPQERHDKFSIELAGTLITDRPCQSRLDGTGEPVFRKHT